MRKRILLIVALTLSAVVIGNILTYFSLKHTAKEMLQNTDSLETGQAVDLLGLLDSFGVPYSKQVSKSFMTMLTEDLCGQGQLSSSLDLYNLYINKTWDLNGIYQNGTTLGEFSELQNFSIDFVRHKYGSRVRDDLIYACPDTLSDVTISNYTAQLKHPVILYSCSANDLFYYFNVSLESLTPRKIWQLICNWDDGLTMLEENIRCNLQTLINCNPNAQIYVMGLYVPSDSFLPQRIGSLFVNAVNHKISAACSSYANTVYVDVSCVAFGVLDGDFHPNQDGQKMLCSLLVNAMNENPGAIPHGTLSHPQAALQQSAEAAAHVIPDHFTSTLAHQITSEALLQSDYVECAVAIEHALYTLGYSDIAASDLQHIRDGFLSYFPSEDKWSRAYNILYAERKLRRGIDLSSYAIDPSIIKNDKLSLDTGE